MQNINIRAFDLNLLTVFVTLWDTRSVTRASDRLALTQPAVSHALRRMRDATGDELFVNAKSGLMPTSRSETLIGPIREALDKIHTALRDQEIFIPSLAQREFHVATGDLVEFVILPQLVEQIAQQAPGIVIRTHAVPEEEGQAYRRLESGDLDVVIGGQAFKEPGVHNETLAQIDLATLIWRRENLRKRRFPLALYLKRPHVVFRLPREQGSFVDQALAQRGMQRHIGAVVQNFMAMPMVAARTGYICNVPRVMADTVAELFELSVHEPPIAFGASPMFMSWHKRFDADPAHAWFLNQIRSMAFLA